MGHITRPDREYQLLQRRLDRNVTGAPDSPVFTQILQLLFSPGEAHIARQIPTRLVSLDALSGKLNMPRDELDASLTRMAERGLVIDVERKGRRYFSLAPVVIGFFEYTFMRTRDELPVGELARLFDAYFYEDDRFVRSIFQGKTQIGRSLVREEALPGEDYTEILDWERASRLVESASAAGVSLCACRHHAQHVGRACDRPLRTCLSFNYGAEALIRAGTAERITNREAMRILEECKQAGLAQTADNVQRQVSYVCNCCGCCCGMYQAIRRFEIKNAIVSSNWIMEIDVSKCNGCSRCSKACPSGAVEIVHEGEGGKRRNWAVRDESLCLGCGVCYATCKRGALSLRPRDQRVFTPETLFDRMVAMAIERGKLADLIFDETDNLSYRALGRIARIVEKSYPVQAAVAVEPLRSAFLSGLVKAAKISAGQTRHLVK